MADKTRAQMIDWILEVVGAKPAGQSASAEVGDVAGRYYDSAYARLRKRGLVPFGSGAVPEWAQAPLAHYVARDCAATFGVTGEQLGKLELEANWSVRELTEQVAVEPQEVPIRPHWM